MKVRSSVKPMCEKCKVIKRKAKSSREKDASGLSVRIPNTSRYRVDIHLLLLDTVS